MASKFRARLSMLLLIGTLSFDAAADTIYNETVSPDLSNSGLSATSLSVLLGSNQLFGTTGSSGSPDRDYFTFTVPEGLQLVAINLLPGTDIGGDLSFIGLQAGNQVTLPVFPPDATGLLGWWHYGAADVGTDILSKMAAPSDGSTGFTVPLASGDYAFWVQELSAGTFSYGLDFIVQASTLVPEPGSMGLLAGGLAALAIAFRRRIRR